MIIKKTLVHESSVPKKELVEGVGSAQIKARIVGWFREQVPLILEDDLTMQTKWDLETQVMHIRSMWTPRRAMVDGKVFPAPRGFGAAGEIVAQLTMKRSSSRSATYQWMGNDTDKNAAIYQAMPD